MINFYRNYIINVLQHWKQKLQIDILHSNILQLLENLQPQVWLYLQSLIKANKNTYINKPVPPET